jgi:hypothetical protein
MNYELKFDILWQTKKYLPFLKREVLVEFISEEGDQEPTARQIALLDSLDALTEEIIEKLAVWARKDFRQRLSNWGMTAEELFEEIAIKIDEQNIYNHFIIDEAVIPRIDGCNANYIFICGSCDWDEEHGIEFLLKNGEPIRCNAQEGLAQNAEWDDYLEQG